MEDEKLQKKAKVSNDREDRTGTTRKETEKPEQATA
jgi:hypothetical protein